MNTEAESGQGFVSMLLSTGDTLSPGESYSVVHVLQTFLYDGPFFKVYNNLQFYKDQWFLWLHDFIDKQGNYLNINLHFVHTDWLDVLLHYGRFICDYFADDATWTPSLILTPLFATPPALAN